MSSSDKPTKGVQYHCDYCHQDISSTVRIKCAACTDFDLCIECFSVGVEIRDHKNDHPYHVMDRLNFPIFNEEWLASEELLLLESIDIFGFGNWDDIAEHVASKTPDQCKEHYQGTYIDSATAPIPDLTKKFEHSEVERTVEKIKMPSSKGKGRSKPMPSQPVNHDLAGFMPKRGEFEVEYENDAEQILVGREFEADDCPTERQIKMELFHIYNQKLDFRSKMREFALTHQLIDLKKRQQKERRRSKETKEVYKRCRALMQLGSTQEYDDFVKGLIAEQTIRKKIRLTQEYRKKGIRSLGEIESYEQSMRREKESLMKKERRENSIYLYPERSRERGSKWLNRDRDSLGDLAFDLNDRPRRKTGTPLDISHSPGVEILSAKERELCSSIRLFPNQYTVIKETLIKEFSKRGELKKSAARQLVKIDVNKTGKLFDFLVESGWINNSTFSAAEGLSQEGIARADTVASPAVQPMDTSADASQAPGTQAQPMEVDS